MARQELPPRRRHVTQKATIANRRRLYLSLDNETDPKEIFLRIGHRSDSEKVVLFDVIARLMSLALQEGIAKERVAEVLYGTKSHPAGPVKGDPRILNCAGTVDYIGRHLLVHCCGRDDLAHRPAEPEPPQPPQEPPEGKTYCPYAGRG